jgi:hypothetical protein
MFWEPGSVPWLPHNAWYEWASIRQYVTTRLSADLVMPPPGHADCPPQLVLESSALRSAPVTQLLASLLSYYPDACLTWDYTTTPPTLVYRAATTPLTRTYLTRDLTLRTDLVPASVEYTVLTSLDSPRVYSVVDGESRTQPGPYNQQLPPHSYLYGYPLGPYGSHSSQVGGQPARYPAGQPGGGRRHLKLPLSIETWEEDDIYRRHYWPGQEQRVYDLLATAQWEGNVTVRGHLRPGDRLTIPGSSTPAVVRSTQWSPSTDTTTAHVGLSYGDVEDVTDRLLQLAHTDRLSARLNPFHRLPVGAPDLLTTAAPVASLEPQPGVTPTALQLVWTCPDPAAVIHVSDSTQPNESSPPHTYPEVSPGTYYAIAVHAGRLPSAVVTATLPA